MNFVVLLNPSTPQRSSELLRQGPQGSVQGGLQSTYIGMYSLFLLHRNFNSTIERYSTGGGGGLYHYLL